MPGKVIVPYEPKRCSFCGLIMTKTWIFGKTLIGRWNNMCPHCHESNGVGLGLGKGQKFKHVDNTWEKIEG